jgi:hypothetical protein
VATVASHARCLHPKNLTKPMNYITSKKGVLILVLPLCLLFISCNQPDTVKSQEVKTIEVKRTGGVTVDPGGDQLAEFFEGMAVSDSLDMAYGVDLRVRKAFQLSLETGEARYLAPEGRGPKELSNPVLLTMKNENEFLIYDVALDQVAEYRDGEIVNKYPGFTSYGVWIRNFNGFYYNGFIITGVVDPEKVRAMDFDNAKPLAFLDFKNENLEKKGDFSPTIDRLDSDSKYPVIYYDSEYNTIFYLFINDHTLMAYDLEQDEATALVSYKPKPFRTKTISVQGSTAGNMNAAMELGLNISTASEIDRIGDQLVVVWKNLNEGYYTNMGDLSSGSVDYFGVLYDLPDLTNPREFTLPGKFHGVYKNKLIITDNYGAEELQLSFYEFVQK